MDQLVTDVIRGLDLMPPSELNSNAQRRFRQVVEVPLATMLGLHVPERTSDLENVYVTYVGESNNIDNRMWQVQNKLLKKSDPRIAVAVCKEAIANDAMWLQSAKILSEIAPYLSPHNFNGILVLAQEPESRTFSVSRKILLRGSPIAEALDSAIPETETQWYSVPLASRRPHATAVEPAAGGLLNSLKAFRNVIVQGVAGIGKSHVFGSLASGFGGTERVEVAVFHPSSNYEDFVEALRPTEDGGFEVVDGRFLEFCRRAAADPDNEYLFIIDEINRASPARVFGDLLYALEPSKRVNAAHAKAFLDFEGGELPLDGFSGLSSMPVKLQLSRRAGNGISYRSFFCVPDNVYLLGTMNTSDHSVGGIDLALRRRFVFERLSPMSPQHLLNSLTSIDERWSWIASEVDTWDRINSSLAEVSPDALIGHSYFFEAIEAAGRREVTDDHDSVCELLWRDLILPQIGAVLEVFDAVHLLSDLDIAAQQSTSNTGGYWIESLGKGLDSRILVVPRTTSHTGFSAPQIRD